MHCPFVAALLGALALVAFVTPVRAESGRIAAGKAHTCVLTSRGAVQCWGGSLRVGDGTKTTRRTPVQVTGLQGGVQAVTAGDWHTCALTTTGAVQCWGIGTDGVLGDGTESTHLEPVAVTGLSSGVRAIAAGGSHTCALTTAGAVKCWGWNSSYQLGDGTNTGRLAPVQVAGLTSGVQAITAGGHHTCALTTAGAVLCWGSNLDGITASAVPAPVAGLSSGVKAIAAGAYHTCALTTAGAVKCWGSNLFGQLGDGTSTSSLAPVPVVGLGSGVQAITAGGGRGTDNTGGGGHTCALTTQGAVLCWGQNEFGQLGDGTPTNRFTPVQVIGLASGVRAISAGGSDIGGAGHTCALNSANTVLCWGDNHQGQLGDGTPTQRLLPVPVSGLGSGVRAIASGSNGNAGHSCALTTLGSVRCWGNNEQGQLGDGTTIERIAPAAVAGLGSGVEAIATGAIHSCALTTSGAVLCWGSNYFGQLGDSTNINRLVPTPVVGLSSGVKAIAAGEYHTCALTTAGAVRCWGNNNWGQLGDGTSTAQPTPVPISGLASDVEAIAAGHTHTCALTTGGAAWCWGDNAYGRLGDGTETDRLTAVQVVGLSSGVTAITAGVYHTCALAGAGAMLCWGLDAYGQLGDGQPGGVSRQLTPVAVIGLGSGVRAIDAGAYHTCAVTAAEALMCWGYNYNGQLGDGTTTPHPTPAVVAGLHTGILSVAATWSNTCALTTTGAVKCWGYNYNGELGDGTPMYRLSPVFSLLNNESRQWQSDFNGDGFSDILWHNASTLANTIWLSGNQATRQAVTTVTNPAWHIAGIGDFDGDGRSDILWHNTTTLANAIWKSGNSATQQAVTTVTNPAWQIAGIGDFDGDGRSDILWHNTTTLANAIWKSGNNATQQAVTTITNPEWQITGIGDFNGDGRSDLFWRNLASGANTLWPSGNYAQRQNSLAISSQAWQVAGVADLNGDARADLLWRNSTTGANTVWWSGNGDTYQGLAGVTSPAWLIVGVGDYNGDGKADLLWRNAATGANTIWSSGNHATQQTVTGVTHLSWTIKS